MQLDVIKIMEPAEAEEIRSALAVLDWKEGRARTEQLTGYIKKNKELKPGEDGELVTALSQKCAKAINANPDVQRKTHLKQMMLPKFNNYDEPDGEYQRHTDAPFMGPVRTDFTAVLNLTDPNAYTGGEHHVVDPLGGEHVIKAGQGEMILYETGYPHWVTPVNDGARISALTWIESTVKTERQRGLLTGLRNVSASLEKRMFDEDLSQEQRDIFRDYFVDVGVTHSGLYRLWANK